MKTFQNNKNFFAQAQLRKTLTASITFELSYFNCDPQIAIRDKKAGSDNKQAYHAAYVYIIISLQKQDNS